MKRRRRRNPPGLFDLKPSWQKFALGLFLIYGVRFLAKPTPPVIPPPGAQS